MEYFIAQDTVFHHELMKNSELTFQSVFLLNFGCTDVPTLRVRGTREVEHLVADEAKVNAVLSGYAHLQKINK